MNFNSFFSVSFSLCRDDDDEDEEEQQTASFNRQKKLISWNLSKIYGSSEQILRVKFNWDDASAVGKNILKEIGSIL